MHNKYVIRDGMTPEAAVWMGSANFTDGAWSLQENNVLILNSPDLAQYYDTDFWELFTSGSITTGRNDTGTVRSTTKTSPSFSRRARAEPSISISRRKSAPLSGGC